MNVVNLQLYNLWRTWLGIEKCSPASWKVGSSCSCLKLVGCMALFRTCSQVDICLLIKKKKGKVKKSVGEGITLDMRRKLCVFSYQWSRVFSKTVSNRAQSFFWGELKKHQAGWAKLCNVCLLITCISGRELRIFLRWFIRETTFMQTKSIAVALRKKEGNFGIGEMESLGWKGPLDCIMDIIEWV